MTVIAHHLIWTNYGTWLPNDPRGSGSQTVYTPALAELAKPHFGRREVQPRRKVVSMFYQQAEPRLQFPVIRFTMEQINEVATAFADVIRENQYTCYSCAIMPDHTHLVIREHKHPAETMIENFQQKSRSSITGVDGIPADHPVWTKNGWHVFLSTPAEVRQRIVYVETNPMKEGLPAQRWPFVTPYNNWPFHRKLN